MISLSPNFFLPTAGIDLNYSSDSKAQRKRPSLQFDTIMPKRKRLEDELEEKLAYHCKELFRMLKVAKGFERQRMAKRQRDPKSTPDKRQRIEKEIVVLKVGFS